MVVVVDLKIKNYHISLKSDHAKMIKYVLKLITYILGPSHMRLSLQLYIDEGGVVDQVAFYGHKNSYASLLYCCFLLNWLDYVN